ncbi:MAG: hypothetical protein M2R45_03519 [Verrucomicrobia subdivision 3 bacterium]|nr:hypothetical protein [Limisphaerales bacterium]MCS1415916.1 hypothetical protein [Limisphaerales bacterium]
MRDTDPVFECLFEEQSPVSVHHRGCKRQRRVERNRHQGSNDRGLDAGSAANREPNAQAICVGFLISREEGYRATSGQTPGAKL